MRASYNKFPCIAHGHRPDLAMVPIEFLDVLELTGEIGHSAIEADIHDIQAYLIAIPILKHSILACRPQIVAVTFVALREVDLFLECHLHDTFIVCEETLVAISEIQTPDFDVLVSRTGCNKLRISGDIERKHWKLGEDVLGMRAKYATTEHTLWP